MEKENQSYEEQRTANDKKRPCRPFLPTGSDDAYFVSYQIRYDDVVVAAPAQPSETAPPNSGGQQSLRRVTSTVGPLQPNRKQEPVYEDMDEVEIVGEVDKSVPETIDLMDEDDD